MKKYFSVLLAVLLVSYISSAGNCIERTKLNCSENDCCQQLKEIKKSPGNRSASETLNKKALDLHKKGKYDEAEQLWYESALADPGWAKPYFNLACVNALKGNSDRALDYLRISIELDNSFIPAAYNDPDLESIRTLTAFKQILGNIINTHCNIVIRGNDVILEQPANKSNMKKIGKLAYDISHQPLELSSIENLYIYNSDRSMLAFYGKTEKDYDYALFVVSENGVLTKVTKNFQLDWQSVFDGLPILWHSRTGSLIFSLQYSIWRYDIKNDSLKQLSYPPEGKMDISPVIASNGNIRFMRGGRLEFSFSGDEYEMDINGDVVNKVNGGRHKKGEVLR
jgi:tetratricopeptide (TPR) repeat protein